MLAQHRVRPTANGVLDGYLEKQAGDLIDVAQFKGVTLVRKLLKKLILWALAADNATHDPAGLDQDASTR